jgi:hypothetical protein
MVIVGVLLLLAAWCLLVLAVPKHHLAVSGRVVPEGRLRLYRAGGWMLLAVSLGCFVARIGWDQGPVFWACALMLGAIAAALLLAALPDRTPARRR